MFENYTVGVKVKLFNEVSGGLMLISKQFAGMSEKALLFQKEIKKSQTLMRDGFGMIAAGGALAAPFVYAISKAAELQKQMLGIQVATNGTTAEMEKMRVAIEKASAPTQFSAVTVAQMAKKVATSNSFSATQLTSVMPEIAKFADVQYILKGTDPLSSVTDAVKMMHLAQKYSPSDINTYFNEVTKASLMMPGGVSELRSALSYMQPMGKAAMGATDKDSIMLVALLSRLGLSGSRGGTNLLAAMTRTIPGVFGSGLLKGKSHEALKDMDFIDKSGHSKFMVDGKFSMDQWVMGLSHFAQEALAKDPKHGRERIMIDFQHAFGTQGGKVAALLSSPAAIAQLAAMGKDFAMLASMGAIQDTFVNQAVSQEYTTAITNFQNVMIELGTNLLPLATHVLKDVNANLSVYIDWMRKNKSLVKEITYDFIKFSAAMVMLGTISALASAFTTLNAILRTTLAITGVTAASSSLAGAGAGLALRTAATAVTLGASAVAGSVGYAVGSMAENHWHLGQKIGGYFYDHLNPKAENLPGGLITNQPGGQTIVIQVDGKQLMQAMVPHMNHSSYLSSIAQSNNFSMGMTPISPNTGVPFR